MSSEGIFRLVLGGMVAMVLLVFFLASLGYEEVTLEKEVGYRGEALKNQYLAASRLLDRMGMDLKSYSGLAARDGLPPTDGLLILPTTRYSLNQQRSTELLSWVYDGGHLIVSPRPLDKEGEEQPDPILSAIGVDWVWSPVLGEFDTALIGVNQTQQPFRLHVNGDKVLYLLEGSPAYWMEAEREEESEGDASPNYHYLGVQHGEGLVSVVANNSGFSNRLIGREENASFFYELSRLEGDPSEAWLVFRESYPSIWSLLIERAWPILVMLVLFVIALLWLMAPRLGPIQPEPSVARRKLMEHITAAGRFLWDRFLAEHLVNATREAMLQRMRTLHPHWINLPPEQVHQHLHERTGLTLERVAEALEEGAFRENEHFQRVITHIETIRRAL